MLRAFQLKINAKVPYKNLKKGSQEHEIGTILLFNSIFIIGMFKAQRIKKIQQ